MRCDTCGRFTTTLHDIWRTSPHPEIDRSVCTRCAALAGALPGPTFTQAELEAS